VRGTDNYYYRKQPVFSIGKFPRNTLDTGAKFAYYGRIDDDFDPMVADKTRKWSAPNVKIGLESRFMSSTSRYTKTPGPEYNPGKRPEIPNDPAYSFGVRRPIPGFDPLAPNVSTPLIVGPGSYLQLDVKNTSEHVDFPKVSFTKERKFRNLQDHAVKHATYDTTSSIGAQVNSRKKTQATVAFGKAKRDAKTGMFRSHMATKNTVVRIKMPKF